MFKWLILVPGPFQLDLHIKVKEKIIGWLDLPCIDNVGSCNYKDICSPTSEECPASFKKHGIPCKCPIPVVRIVRKMHSQFTHFATNICTVQFHFLNLLLKNPLYWPVYL